MALPPNTPLKPIIKTDNGRLQELTPGVGENQPARASDVNPIITFLNERTGVNATTGTTGNSTTINAFAGKFTTATLTTAVTSGTGSPVTALTVTNNLVTTSSIVLAQISAYGGTTGQPAIIRTVPAAGSFVISVANVGTAVLNGTITVRFIVL